MSSGSRFETDLQALRAARGLSLAQIQQQTRIPVDVLRRFENGELIGDPTYNEVYLKAFLKSYAKALGASPTEVVNAYTAQKAGSYQGALHPGYKADAAPPRAEPPAPAAPSAPAPESGADEPSPAESDTRPPSAAAASPVTAVRLDPPKPSTPSSAPSVQASRVARPAVPGAKHSYDKNWGTIIGLFVAAVAILATLLYFLVFSGGDEAEDVADVPSPNDVAAVDSAGVGAGAGIGGKRLQLPIQVTVTATGGKLQNFRVTAAPDERRGYWLEEGASETYESDSLIVLWGEGAEGLGPEATIELQGERWTPASGQVLRIDRESGQRLLDSLSAVGAAPAAESGGA